MSIVMARFTTTENEIS